MANFHPQKITAIVQQKVLLTLTYFIHLYTLNTIFKVLTQYVADPNRKESVIWSHEGPEDFFLFSH